MAYSYRANESITGYITNVSNENKKTKHYVKFTMVSQNNQIIDGWVFSLSAGILTTPLGEALSNSLKNKTGIKLWGSLDNNNGFKTFRMSALSKKYQTINLSFQLPTLSNDILFIKDALMSVELNSIRVSVLHIRPPENLSSQGVAKTATFVLIGDQTGTTYLAGMDLPADILNVQQIYDITKVRKKTFNGASILSTTVDTRISLSTVVIVPDVVDIAQTMSIDLTDRKTVTTTIMEVGEIQRIFSCSTCNGKLSAVNGAPALLHCEKCHRHVLKKNATQRISTTLLLRFDQKNIILIVADRLFHKLIDIIGLNVNMISTDIAFEFMTYGNLVFEYSELGRELLEVSKP